MNKHILNGNKILGTAKQKKPPISIGSIINAETHFYGDDETVAKATKEYLLALYDELTDAETEIVENRLYELSCGLVNLWIAKHYAEENDDISLSDKQTRLAEKVKVFAGTPPEQLPVVEKLIDEMHQYITNVEWINTDETYPQEPSLVVIFHDSPEKATEFAEKLPLGLETYCRADTGYVRINLPVKHDSTTKQEITARDVFQTFELDRKSKDELIALVVNLGLSLSSAEEVSAAHVFETFELEGRSEDDLIALIISLCLYTNNAQETEMPETRREHSANTVPTFAYCA